jgi:prolipoprotein diacylglyceryltransferase
MNPISIETFGLMLILAYVLMCAIFLLFQKQGKNFVDSFDKAFLWGSFVFIIGYGLDTVTYVTTTMA